MPGVAFKVTGAILFDGERADLLLRQDGREYTLRLGFVLRGTEEPFLPESLLDDWGHEIKGADLYRWVKENASHFPRAELFGHDLRGRPQQCFIREVEVTARYACFLFDSPNTPLQDGLRIGGILLPADVSGRQKYGEPPAKIPFPLREADVEWWAVDLAQIGRSGVDSYNALDRDGRK